MSRTDRGGLQRFAAVGAAVTTVDLGLLITLERRARLPVTAADAVAITGAAAVSYPLHRVITFAEDPYVRWVEMPGAYVAVALVTGACDVAVVSVLGRLRRPTTTGGVIAVKVPALLAAATLRAVAYRWVLATGVIRDLGERSPRPPSPGVHRLTVVVPAFGEADRIGATVSRLRAELEDGLRGQHSHGPGSSTATGATGVEIIVVDDGSVDGTAEAARAAGAAQVIVQPRNRGKGAAVRAGVAAARGATVAFVDADLSYAPDQLLRLLAQVEAGWDVAVGSRKHTDTTTLVRARRLREVGGRIINLLTHAVLLGRHRDTQCGIKAFRSDVAKALFAQSRIDGFAFDVELFHLAERHHLSLVEVPVEVTNSSRSTVSVSRDAVRLLRDLARIRRGAADGWYDQPLQL